MIIVPFDFSRKSLLAIDQAIYIADVSGMPIEIIHVSNDAAIREYPRNWNYKSFNRKSLENKLHTVVEHRINKLLPKNAIKYSYHITESVLISGAIIKRALAVKAKLIIMGTHGFSGIKEKLFGSNTSSLINQALLPVLALPMHWKPNPIHHFFIAAENDTIKKREKLVEPWLKLLKGTAEWVEFYYLPDKAKEKKLKTEMPELRYVKASVSNTLAENLVKYTQGNRKHTALIMFIHQRNLLEKIFNSSITEQVSGLIKIPLLAIPVKE